MMTESFLVSREAYLAWKLRVASCSFLVCEQLETRNAKRGRTNNASRFTVFLLATAFSLSLNLNLSHAASFGLADRVVEYKLANGLTVLMVERHQTPVVS